MASSPIRCYRLLDRYLATLPAEQATAHLTLAELAAMLGPATSAPPSRMPNWNAADLARVFRHRAGFAAAFNRYDHAITFTRTASAPRTAQEA